MKIRSAFLCVSLVVLSLAIIEYSNAEVDPASIVGVWYFDEGAGDVAEDASGNGRDGVIQGAEWDDGKFGGALNFEKGDTVVIELGDAIITNEVSIVVWLQFGDMVGQQNYFSIWDGSNNRYVPYKTDGHELRFWSNGWNVGSGFIVDGDTWYHVANVYDGDTVSIYIDGELKVSQAGSFTLAENQQAAWVATDKGGWISSCMEDEVGIFNAALTENEVKAIMNNGMAWALGDAAVEPSEKLPAVWGGIKHF